MKPPPYCTLSLDYLCSFHVCVNTFFFSLETDLVAPADAETMAADFYADVAPPFLAAVATDVDLYGVHCRAFSSSDTVDGFAGPGGTGTVPGQALMAQDIAELKLHIDRTPGRRLVRGKAYMSGTPKTGAAQGNLTAAQVTAWDTFAQAVIDFTGGTFGGASLVMWSPRDNAFKDVTFIGVPEVVKTLRRRRPST